MKIKLMVIFFALLLLSACGNSNSESGTFSYSADSSSSQLITEKTSMHTNSTLSESEMTEPIREVGKEISSFASELDKANISYSEEDIYFEMIGAIDGRRFVIDDEYVEIYLFDKAGDLYKKAEEDGTLSYDFGKSVGLTGAIVNNGLVLYSENVSENIIDIFESM